MEMEDVCVLGETLALERWSSPVSLVWVCAPRPPLPQGSVPVFAQSFRCQQWDWVSLWHSQSSAVAKVQLV